MWIAVIFLFFNIILAYPSDLNHNKDDCDQCFEELNEGDLCQRGALSGVCRLIEDCVIALKSLRTSGRHDLKRCGFVKDQEVVCCPDASDRKILLDSTTPDGPIWSGDFDQANLKVPTSGTDNSGRAKTKTKSEIMCEKILKENNVKPTIEFNILKGENSKLGEFPYMVALGIENDNGDIDFRRCGASLISSKHLLTAAHCFTCSSCKPALKARLGIVDITDVSSAQEIDVKNMTLYPDYNPQTKHNDIAVLELASPVRMSRNTYPACLYNEVSDPPRLIVTGWGNTVASQEEKRATILQKANLQPVPVQQCNTSVILKNQLSSITIVNTQICAKSFTSDADACTGDSGGPLAFEDNGAFYLVGITSYGVGCGSATVPGIYTRVATYLKWIEDIVWPD